MGGGGGGGRMEKLYEFSFPGFVLSFADDVPADTEGIGGGGGGGRRRDVASSC